MIRPPTEKATLTAHGLSGPLTALRSTFPSAPAAAPMPCSVGPFRHTIRPARARRPRSQRDQRADTQRRSRDRSGGVYPHPSAPLHGARKDCLHCPPKAGRLPSPGASAAHSRPNTPQGARLRPSGTAKIPIARRPALPRNGSVQQTSARMLARSATASLARLAPDASYWTLLIMRLSSDGGDRRRSVP